MSVHVYGVNRVAIQVNKIEKAKVFYREVFNLELQSGGEGHAFSKIGEHQFLAMFEVEKLSPPDGRHFGLMVRDENQLTQVREKVTRK